MVVEEKGTCRVVVVTCICKLVVVVVMGICRASQVVVVVGICTCKLVVVVIYICRVSLVVEEMNSRTCHQLRFEMASLERLLLPIQE